MIKLELQKVLSNHPGVAEVVWLESALHVYPQEMRETVLGQIKEMKDRVDVSSWAMAIANP
jgi:hypothetical protein